MARVLLLQFDTDPDRESRRRLLSDAGQQLSEAEPRWPTFFDAVRSERPDLIVIAASRIPSHAFEAARYLGDGFNTRNIPVLLVDVAAGDAVRAQSSAPRARIVERANLRDVVQQSLEPTVPESARLRS